MSTSSRERIASAIAAMPVVNHHEHAWKSFSLDHQQEFDLPCFLCEGYLKGDLVAAGMPPDSDLFAYLSDPGLPDGTERAWATLRPFLDLVRSTSYFRYLLRALDDLFGVSEADVFSGDWRAASNRIRQYSREQKGRGGELCERMGVTVTILDVRYGIAKLPPVVSSPHRIVHVARLDWFIHEERELAETLQEYAPKSFDEWLDAFDSAFRRSLAGGAEGFKSGLAYNRRIEYSDPSYDEAAGVFQCGLLSASPEDKTLYQDFMMNRLCRLCVEADVPLQIHTGIQAGNWHVLEDTRPTLLTSLFRRHPDLRVDLFHGGYPWVVQAGLMAKYFPNVYVDGCWLAHISPTAYRAALTSWIETVPMNKILAWGGDEVFVEQTYASLSLARDLVADVLADLVDRGYFDVDLALEVGRHILGANGASFWRLDLPVHQTQSATVAQG